LHISKATDYNTLGTWHVERWAVNTDCAVKDYTQGNGIKASLTRSPAVAEIADRTACDALINGHLA